MIKPKNEEIQNFLQTGILYTGIPKQSSKKLKDCFKNFLLQPKDYKYSFLQKHFGYAFDGYSFLGQQDSKNQGEEDLVHTFVLSDFFDIKRYPVEFQKFLIQKWLDLDTLIRSIEKAILGSLYPSLIPIYNTSMGHMISANYYPPVSKSQSIDRLTAHPDASLFTVFPFGIDEDFIFETPQGKWKSLKKADEIICFSGYLLELLTEGEIKALNHKVKFNPNKLEERFSFAFFSLPKPTEALIIQNEEVTGEAYFTRYLSLFD